jgi:hypothetical protein
MAPGGGQTGQRRRCPQIRTRDSAERKAAGTRQGRRGAGSSVPGGRGRGGAGAASRRAGGSVPGGAGAASGIPSAAGAWLARSQSRPRAVAYPGWHSLHAFCLKTVRTQPPNSSTKINILV